MKLYLFIIYLLKQDQLRHKTSRTLTQTLYTDTELYMYK